MPHKTFIALLTVILLVLPGFFAAAQEDDPTFSFTNLNETPVIEDQFEGAVTARLYTFTGSEDDQVSISMSGEFDSYLILFGNAGQLLTFIDEGGEKRGDAFIEDFTLPYDGAYYVIATSYNYVDGIMASSPELNQPQPYSLNLTGATVPDDMETPALTATSITAGSSMDGELTAESPIGYFTFEGEESAQMDLAFSLDNVSSYPMLYLFDSAGNRLGISPQMDETPEADFLDFVLPVDGSYLVMALDSFFVDIDADSGDYGIGDFTISLEME